MLNALPLAALLASNPAHSAEKEPSHVQAELLAEQSSIQPGGKITLGVRLKMSGGWHTYWRNPGDSGMATKVTWILPPGFKAGELRWAYPKRFSGKKSTSFGFDDEATLLAELSVPAPIAEKSVMIAAKVEWLECKEICVSGEAELSIKLPAKKSPPAIDRAAARIFENARRRLPKKIGEGAFAGWTARAARTESGVALTIPSPEPQGVFFPYDDSAVDNAPAAGATTCGGGGCSTIGLRRSRAQGASKATRLTGVFVSIRLGQAAEIAIPIEDESPRRKQ